MNKNAERGSAIIMLFIGVALFGMLAYAFMQGSRTSTSWLETEQDRAAATGSQDCSNAVDMALKRLEARGCGNMISVAADGSNADPDAPTDGSCSVYHTNGGGVKPCTGIGGPADCTGLGDASYNDATSGHCYYLVENDSDYATAQAECAGNGAYLASITSAAETTAIGNLGLSNYAFIGHNDQAVEGDWRYTTGELAGTQFWSGGAGGSVVGGQYSVWESGQPAPDNDPDEDCGYINNAGGYEWGDFPCGWSLEFICEKTGTP